ncbi:MAG: hypothetical protein UX37_C0004G0036 [Microgenomates group bacterium GW2011_GWA2_46_16]|nr:MAG: hypothetical protein UX37_C0004G0036 [Microgenomates group bacterium GW2011_GWA2_46_16]
MNNLFIILLTSGFFTWIGWPFTKLLNKITLVERLGLSFLLGIGLGTYGWFILYRLGLPFTLSSLLLTGLLLLFLGNVLGRFYPRSIHLTISSPRPLDKLLIILIGLGLLSAFVIGSYNAITAWDSMALYDFRAHAILLNHDLRDIVDSSYYLSYPLLVSLLHASVYFFGGTNPQGLHSLMFAAFLAVVFGRVYSWTNLRLALLAVFLNLFSYELLMHSTIAYANLPYTIYLVLGFIFAVSGSGKFTHHLLFAGLLIGLSTWVRSTEIFWLIGILVIAYQGLVNWKIFLPLLSILLLLSLRYGWSGYYTKLISVLPEQPQTYGRLLSLETFTAIYHNLPKIYEYIMRYVISPFLGIWTLAVGMGIQSFRLKLRPVRILTFIIFASLAATIAGISVYSTFFATWYQIGDSARRMLMFLIPLTLIGAVLALSRFSEGNHDQTR